MVCKEDVVSWFKELESYKRIDTMCTLLNMCLPFELRFVGTYLEELGKRDFQELRGAERRANTPTDLAADICGANADSRTRRKMALYVSLLRSCNYVCATTLYNVMVDLEKTGLLSGLYGDPLEELLLLYTMALHHPAFTFDQRSHCGEILEKLKIEDQRVQYVETQSHVNSVPSSSCLAHANIPQNLSVPPPNVALGPPPGLVYVKTSQMPMVPGIGDDINDMASTTVALANTPLSTANATPFPVLTEVHPPPGLPMPQYNMADFIVTQAPWSSGLIMSHMNQPLEVMSYAPPQSPLMSQSSSPTASRPGSPGRAALALPPPRPARRRPSQDATPPPPPDLPLPLHQHLPVLTSNFNNMTINEIRHLDDERLRELGVPVNAVAQLRALEKANGIRRVAARSSGSDSSSDNTTPPGTPAPPPHGPGRGRAPPALAYSFAPHFRRPYAAFPAFRPPPFANGEPPPPASYAGYVPVLYAAGAPKPSCYNCGGAGHLGHDCKEPSFEEVTRAGNYQLDFSTAPPDPHDK